MGGSRLSCLVRIHRQSSPVSNSFGDYVVGFDGKFIGNLRIGDSLTVQADAGFHSVTFTIAAHPNRRLSIYVPEGAREMDFYAKISPLNHEISIDQNREESAAARRAAAEEEEEEEALPLRQTQEVRRYSAPAQGRSFTLGAVSLALGGAALFNALRFQDFVVAIFALLFGLATLLLGRSQRAAMGIAGIFLAAASVAIAALMQTGLAFLFPRPQPTESLTQAADRVRELSEGQNAVLYDGEEAKISFRRLYEVDFVTGECYLQLKVENRTGENAVLHVANATANGSSITAVSGLSNIIRAGEIVSTPLVLSYGNSGIQSLDDINTVSLELILVSSSDNTRELFHSPPMELGFRT